MKKVKSFQSSDGQLFLDGGKLVTHELTQVIVKSDADITPERAGTIAAALVGSHAVLFDALKLLRAPVKRKPKTPAAAKPGAINTAASAKK
jgi:hypothetical protein